MKQKIIHIALAAALLSMSAAQASEFDGSWIGAKAGSNRSSASGVDRQNTTSYGLEGGHNWNVGTVLLGVDGFADLNDKTTHNPGAVEYGSHTYGLDAKLGLPVGKWLPFAKLGYARTEGNGAADAIGSSEAHYGLGVEYKVAPNWSLAGEYSSGTAKNNAGKLNNDNFRLGVNYYFEKTKIAPVAPVAAPATAPAPAPVLAKVEPKPKPEAAPAPAPVEEPIPETWKTLLENKSVCIEGANFEFDSAKLRSQEIQKLNEVVSFAEKYKDKQLESSGHTCDMGTEAYNQKLSERRAEAVKAYLTKKGVAADRIETIGYGESRPMADNKTREGREQNRRVEVCTTIKVEKKVSATK